MADQNQLTTPPVIPLTKKALSQHDYTTHILSFLNSDIESSVFPLTEADINRRNQIRSLGSAIRWGGLLAINTLGLFCYNRYKPLKTQIAIASILGSLGTIFVGDFITLSQSAKYLNYRFQISPDSIPEQRFNGNFDRYMEDQNTQAPQK